MLTAFAAAVHLIRERKTLSRIRVLEILVLWSLVVGFGVAGVVGFLGHTLAADAIATSIGWPAGNLFQQEVAVANLAVASLGLPGTGNFIGEFLVLFGAFASQPWIVVIATTGLVLSSVYSLAMIHRAYYGPGQSDTPLQGLDAREAGMVLSLVVLLVLLGIYPQPVLDTSMATMQGVQQWLGAALSQLVSAR